MKTRITWTVSVLILLVAGLAWGLESNKYARDSKLPAEFLGFQGKITGEIMSLFDTRVAFFMKVTKVEPSAASKAKTPNSVVGRYVLIAVREAEVNGHAVPDAAAWKWIKGLAVGQSVTPTVVEEKENLYITEVPK